MVQMSNIIVGIEIEAIVCQSKHSALDVGHYHSGIINKGLAGWKVERDASVHPINDFPTNLPCEFVSSKIFGEKIYQTYLSNFKKYISKNGNYPLKEVISFNKTCGCHIHFTIKDFKFQDKVWYMIYPKVRQYFFKRVLESNIKNKSAIVGHYNRSFAKKFMVTHIKNKERRAEFNFGSEDQGKGLELRGINLLQIETWKEFDEMFEIIWDTLEYMYNLSVKWEYKFYFSKSGWEITQFEQLFNEHYANADVVIHDDLEDNIYV